MADVETSPPPAASLPGGHVECPGCTLRTDDWQAGPVATFLGLLLFVIYTTWAALQGEHYFHQNYLSPFYSPVLVTLLVDAEGNEVPGGAPADHSWFGTIEAGEWPRWIPLSFSPALLILIFPGAFRLTCYYYRKAYYRSFAATPPACAVGPIRQGKYGGETFLLLFQNLHRYTMYFALAFVVILYYDAYVAFFRHGRLGVGLGTIVLLVNATLLACYTLGCHSLRHLLGGRHNRFSEHPLAHWLWRKNTFLNERHMKFAWISLFWVGFADFYVRMVSMGYFSDPSIGW